MNHLACIMDGNRRWAQSHGYPTIAGYQKGLEAVKIVVDFCVQKQIPYLSLFVFSVQNMQRAAQEKELLFTVMHQALEQALDFVRTHNARVFFSGNLALFPADIQKLCARVADETKDATGLTLTLLFGYGGQEDIVQATQKIALDLQQGFITADDITHQRFLSYLWTGHVPAPDMLVRTGNMCRLSNCLLYQAAYTELYFLPVLWPALTVEHLEQAYAFFKNAQRNFGL